MPQLNPTLCIDNAPHDFVFLRDYVEEVAWHHFVTKDVFYCKKCLKQEAVERADKQERRW